jgi:hypothetical protein
MPLSLVAYQRCGDRHGAHSDALRYYCVLYFWLAALPAAQPVSKVDKHVNGRWSGWAEVRTTARRCSRCGSDVSSRFQPKLVR